MTDSVLLLTPGSMLAGRYSIDELIGRGGMGTVYRGRDERLARTVAIKVLHQARDTARERFLSEGRAVAQLAHPNIVTVHDVGEHEGQPFLVMELVDGPNLHDARPENLDDALEIMCQVTRALGHAHEAGIVHRDVKPENVLLRSGSGGTLAKLTDLGLAVALSSERITQEGAISGTPEYMAPEQALGKPVDARTDLYALGVCLYDLATGILPFRADDAFAVISQHVHAPLVPPRALRSDLSPELDGIIVRLLEKEPDRRFASAAELLEALTTLPATLSSAPPEITRIDALARGRLVGRGDELAHLRRAWNEARESGAKAMLLSGEPGAGKTRLALEMANYVEVTGATVLWGGCYELEAATPYLPFVEALRYWIHEASDDELHAALADGAPVLAPLAPEIESRLGSLAPPSKLGAAEERLRLFDHASRFLERAAGDTGALFVIDDVQWADQGTLGLLHYVLRRPFAGRLLVVATFRNAELDQGHATARTISEWQRRRLLERIPVDRLSAQDTAQLVGVLLDQTDVADELAASLHEETEGNPFFLEEVVKSLVDTGHLFREAGTWRRCKTTELVLPPSVRATIERRLDRVSEASLAILRTAAVLGKQFDFELLVQATGGDEDVALHAIEEAERAQLVVARGPHDFAFTHDKIREALYEDVNAVRRRRIHRCIAEALDAARTAGRDIPTEDLAHHYVSAGDHARGLEHACAAALEALAVYAFDEAITLLLDALGCAESLDDRSSIARVENELAEAYGGLGDLGKSLAHRRRAIEFEPDAALATSLEIRAAETLVNIGDAEGRQWVERALAKLEPDAQCGDEARARMVLARYAHLDGLPGDAARELESALRLALQCPDKQLLGRIHAFLAGTSQHLAEFDASDGWARECQRHGKRYGDAMSVALGEEFLGENALGRGTWRAAIAHADRLLELGHAIHSLERRAWSRLPPGYGYYELGEYEASILAYREGVQLAEQSGDTRLRGMLGVYFSLPLEAAGRSDEARAEAARSEQIAERLAGATAYWKTVASRLATRQGRFDDAVALVRLWEPEMRATQERWIPMAAAAETAEAFVAKGLHDEARALIDWTLTIAETSNSEHHLGVGLRERARLRGALGESIEARADLDRAIEILTRTESATALEIARRIAL